MANSRAMGASNLGVPGNIDDTAFASSWDGVTDVAPSKNAVYDVTKGIHCALQGSGTVSLTAGVEKQVTNLAVTTDTASGWDDTNKKYVVQEDGLYLITGTFYVFDSSNLIDYGHLRFKVNNSTVYKKRTQDGQPGNHRYITGTGVFAVPCVAGDEITFTAQVYGAASLLYNTETYYSISRISI